MAVSHGTVRHEPRAKIASVVGGCAGREILSPVLQSSI